MYQNLYLAQGQVKGEDPNQTDAVSWMSVWGTRTGSRFLSLENWQVYLINVFQKYSIED